MYDLVAWIDDYKLLLTYLNKSVEFPYGLEVPEVAFLLIT
jgi:hypothetical protein